MLIMVKPLDPVTAKTLARHTLEIGRVMFDDHVRARMIQRKITLIDVYRILRAGAPQ